MNGLEPVDRMDGIGRMGWIKCDGMEWIGPRGQQAPPFTLHPPAGYSAQHGADQPIELLVFSSTPPCLSFPTRAASMALVTPSKRRLPRAVLGRAGLSPFSR